MDEAVSAASALWLAGAALLMAAPAGAQAWPDPTRPPAAVIAPAAGAMAAAPVVHEPRLQSILLSTREGGRQVAVIDGVTLRLGEKFGDAVLIRMTPTTVVLRRGKQLQTLKLYAAPAGRATKQ